MCHCICIHIKGPVNGFIYSLKDKPNLSYLEATLNEVQRIVGVAYMGIFRVAKVELFLIIFVVKQCENNVSDPQKHEILFWRMCFFVCVHVRASLRLK